MYWQLLVLSLPTENATARMRAWRALKACGAAVLRDGVYLLPDGDAHRARCRRSRPTCASTAARRACCAPKRWTKTSRRCSTAAPSSAPCWPRSAR